MRGNSDLFRVARARDVRVVDACAGLGVVLILSGVFTTFGTGPTLIVLGLILMVVAWAWV